MPPSTTLNLEIFRDIILGHSDKPYLSGIGILLLLQDGKSHTQRRLLFLASGVAYERLDPTEALLTTVHSTPSFMELKSLGTSK